MKRRELLKLTGAAAAAGMGIQGRAWASESAYPTRTIRLVCPFPPGGAVDAVSRALAASMGQVLDKHLVVDNRSGAGGMVGSAAVAKASPDGYTLLFNSSSLVQAPLVSETKLYEPLKDFTVIGSLGSTTMPFVVKADLPVSTLEEFVAYARGKSLSYGSYSPGTTSHAFQQLFSDHNKLDMVHIPYRGEAPMLVALLGGEIPCAIGTMSTLAPQIEAGNIKALAVVGNQRAKNLPNVPTFSELGYPSDFDWPGGFMGLFGPQGLSEEVTAKLADTFKKAVDTDQMRRALENHYVNVKVVVREEAQKEVETTYNAWERIVNKLGLAPKAT